MRYLKLGIAALIIIVGFLLLMTTSTIAAGPGDGNLLKRSGEETCHACHRTYKNAPGDPDAIKSHSSTSNTKWPSGWGIAGGKYGEIVCTTCHTTHNTKNIYLIREQITAPNAPTDQFPGSTVDFRYLSGAAGGDSGYYTFGDDTACYEASYTDQTTCQANGGIWNSVINRCNYPSLMSSASCTSAGHEWSPRTTSTRVCEVCHSKNKYHNYDSTQNQVNGGNFTHNNAGDCTSCHPHSAGFTPDGGACDSCHGNPPTVNTLGGPDGLAKYPDNSGTGSNTAGNHQYHAASSGLNLSCTTCHTDYVMPENSSKTIQIGFNIFGAGGGSYNGQTGVSYQGTNGTTVTNGGLRQCSNIYCHSSVQADGGTGAPTYATPTWGGTSPGCSGCHPDMQGSGTSNHLKHTSTYTFACSACHNNAGSGTTNHVNHNIDVFINSTYGSTASYSQMPNNLPQNGYGSCSSVYCHSTGQGSTGGPLQAGDYATPSWGGAALNCGSCHKNMRTDTAATGSHVQHAQTQSIACATCHNGYTDSTVDTTTHVNTQINLSFSGQASGTTYSQGTSHAAQNGYGSCSTNQCHGSGSPTWGNNTNNNTCTKCHGTPTAGTVDTTNRYLVAPPVNTGGQTGTLTGTGQVSNDSKVGAHQTHLRYLNGLRATTMDNYDNRCEYCHGTLPTSGTHANGSSVPSFQGLATNNGSMAASYNAGSCSNTYCHNPAGTGGILNTSNVGSTSTPSWTDASYIADGTLQTQANCGRCHKVPGDAGFTSSFNHTGITVGPGTCTSCHGHSGDTNGAAGQRHMDGIKYGGGNCDSCHDFDVVGATYSNGKWTGGTWGKNHYDNVNEGWGAHAKHINHIKTVLNITNPLNPAGQSFGTGDAANVCGTCHTNSGANHTVSGSTLRTINFGDGTYKYGGTTGFSFIFGSTNPIYNGISGVSSASTPKTCSNISCHFSVTPYWSSY